MVFRWRSSSPLHDAICCHRARCSSVSARGSISCGRHRAPVSIERQWTLRGAIEWSYDLLQPEEQQLFASLAVFVGGFTLAAAEQVAEQPDLDILEGVESLFRNNLLTTEHAAGDDPRLGMLETIREFALERLAARGDEGAVRRRHAAFYLVLAEDAEPGLLGPQQREWLERLDAERDNIRAALGWALDAGEAEMGLTIGSALWRFWQLRNHELEARERLEELLALGSGSARTRAKAQTMVGSLSFVLGEFETARRVLQESLPVHRRLGDTRMISSTLGLLAVTSGDPDSALALSRESLQVARNGDDESLEGHGLWHVGMALLRVGEIDDAERAFEDAVGHRTLATETCGASARGRSRSPALRSSGAITPARGVSSKRAWPSTETWTTHGVSRTPSPTSPSSRSMPTTPRRRARCSPRRSRSSARAAISHASRTRSRCRRGSPQRTGSRRSPFGSTPAPRCSASACTA